MDSHACKTSMLWNWDVVDSCFIFEQWHIHSSQQYAESLVGIFFLVIFAEGLHRLSRAYDAYVLRRDKKKRSVFRVLKLSESERAARFRPTIMQQLIRSLFHCVGFSAAYLLMLAAMSYNGGVILTVLVSFSYLQ
ncbi:Ctr copper transporter [Mycena rebaudengoi]|nr:Ctr copper transporter [Mycena rebaudengoi]